MKQQEIWGNNTSDIVVTDIINGYLNSGIFQKELASLINSVCVKNQYTKVIEVGCESGTTCMLLNNDLDKTFLDYNEDIIRKVELACKQLNIKASFVNEDMFSMSCADKSYDVVFNSGVIEHYNKEERIRIINEYCRILDDRGTLILAIPNHYSFPYRSAYLLKKVFLRGYQWPWPKEFKIYDLEEELEATGMKLIQRVTLAKECIFYFWNFVKPLMYILKASDVLFNYEGYLTTLVIRKK